MTDNKKIWQLVLTLRDIISDGRKVAEIREGGGSLHIMDMVM